MIGLVVFLFSTAFRPRRTSVFVGGETMTEEEARIPGSEFYSSIKQITHLPIIYERADAGIYDLYNVLMKFAEGFASLVFRFIDRFIDQVINAVTEAIRFLGGTLRSLSAWYIFGSIVVLLSYAATGSLLKFQTFALVLLLGGPLIALTENNLNSFYLAIGTGQLGLALLGFASGLADGKSIGLFHLINSLVALEIVFIGIKTAINLTGKTNINEIKGFIHNAGVTSVGFIVGGSCYHASHPVRTS